MEILYLVINFTEMKLNLFLFLSFYFNLALFAQDKTLDSLFVSLKKANNQTEQLEVFNSIAEHYKYSDPNKMIIYGNKALQLAQKTNNEMEEANANLNLGNASIILGKYQKAFNYFSLAKTIFENQSQNDTAKKGLAKALGSIGIIFSEQSNYSRALQHYLKSITIYEALNDQEKCAKLFNNIGVIYQSQKSYTRAIAYFKKAQKIQENRNDVNLGITYTNIANSYLKQKNSRKAFDFYQKAKSNLDKNPNPRALGEWYNNFG